MNQYFSDHVNLWFIYQDYNRHRIDIHWCVENGYNCSSFGIIDEEVLSIKNTLIQQGLPIFAQKDTLVSKVQRIKNCVKAGLVLNVANQIPDDKGNYVSERFKISLDQLILLAKRLKLLTMLLNCSPRLLCMIQLV